MNRVANITKCKPGSISWGIRDELLKAGYTTINPHESWRINEPINFHKDSEVLVNTAGVTSTGKPHEYCFEEIQRVIDVNLTGAIAITSGFVEATKGNGKSKTIIHVGSLWSRKHATNSAIYTASKAGLAHYIACMGYELNLHYPDEFTIIGIHPGNVAGTPMSVAVQKNLIEERGMTASDVKSLYKNAITPNEIGKFVLSCLNNRWLNGENIYLGAGDKR